MSDKCNFSEILAHRQLRPTPLRLKVLEILASGNRPWQAREILETMRDRRPAHKVTIYRILEELERMGLVRKVTSEGGAAYYELACEHHPPHPHFHCQACGAVQCLEPVPLERFWQEVKGPVGNRVDRLEIRVAGLCHKCREKVKNATE